MIGAPLRARRIVHDGVAVMRREQDREKAPSPIGEGA
jgi:hypothetical protein